MLEHGGRVKRAAAEYGIAEQHWLDLSTGVNPNGWIAPVVPQAHWQALPQDEDDLHAAACEYYGSASLLAVAGSQAAIQTLPRLFAPSRVALLTPSYAEHAHAWLQAGSEVVWVSATEILHLDETINIVVLVNPNNPTGQTFARADLLALRATLAARGGTLIVDEAFMDVTPEHSLTQDCPSAGLIVLRSIGKFFGLAGARVGFVLAEAAILFRLRVLLGPWPIAAPSRFVVSRALRDTAWHAATRKALPQVAVRLCALLEQYGLPVSGSTALFAWVQHDNAESVHRQLAQQGVLTRCFSASASLRFGLPRDEVQWSKLEAVLAQREFPYPNPLMDQLANYLSPRSGKSLVIQKRERSGAYTVMVQGTTSDAGKSTLVAALCRWLVRRGVRVAPFKPQNMALNSAVTCDGGEIGRAQAVQAHAAKIVPHTDMNPVLLKPNSDTGAQVIIHGHAIGNMEALEYHDYKHTARAVVLQSYQRLALQYQAVVVEGAGSPAEINLRAGDIANMGFAEAVDCPVILIADIDRGGVFAHLVGTLALLSETEQARVAGFVINRFRGDIALLQDGLDWLEQRTGKPVLGVLPYLHGLHLEAEDALPVFHPSSAGERVEDEGKLRVVVPVLPHISNHTDFDALRLHPQVALIFAPITAPLPSADLIILPGSKNVRSDLDSLRRAGWEAAINQHLRYGGKLIGICGGMQMLGIAIHDPLGIEGEAGSSPGLAYLSLDTTLAAHKQLRNVEGVLLLGGAMVSGYEIHAGMSTGEALDRPLLRLGERDDGAISNDGKILASYVHGLFNSEHACAALLCWAGLDDVGTFDYAARREADIERLADAVEQYLDARKLVALFGLEGAHA